MVAVTLRFLAGAKVLDLGWPYGLAQSTVCVVIDETLDAMNSRLDNIHFPSSVEDCEREASAFQRLRGSPIYGFIAALDGIAIAIRCPTDGDFADARKFFNRKGFFAISVQAVFLPRTRLRSFQRSMPGPRMTRRPLLRRPCTTISPSPRRMGVCPPGPSLQRTTRTVLVALAGGSSRRITVETLTISRTRLTTTFPRCELPSNRYLALLCPGGAFCGPRYDARWREQPELLVVCAKLHNYIIDQRIGRGDNLDFNDIPGPDPDNNVQGEPEVFLRDYLHLDREVARHIRQGSGTLRDELANQLRILGLQRPGRQG
jgi:hypothetical protein